MCLAFRDLENSEPTSVKLIGYVGAGAAAHYYDDRSWHGPGARRRNARHGSDGNSRRKHGPLFEQWLVYYDEVRSPVTPDMIGRLCASSAWLMAESW
jgi:hypothetical protein